MSSALSPGSPLRSHPSGVGRAEALLQRTAVRSRAENGSPAASSRPSAVGRSSRPSAQKQRTVISPVVSVPVLSVQITSVEPSVSTAVRRLMSARRRAIRRTPTASARVIVGSSPSGTFATIRPIANGAASLSGRPASVVPMNRNTTPNATATPAMSSAARLTWRWSGLRILVHALGERGDPPELSRHPGGEHDADRLTAGAQRSREDQIVGLERRGRRASLARRCARPAAPRR